MQDINNLSSKLKSESEKNQLKLIPQLVETGESGYQSLMIWMSSCQGNPVNLAIGKAYQALYQANTPETKKFLQTNFPQGVVPLVSDKNIDYTNLQQLLAQQDFQQADVVTIQKLCELAGSSAMERKWLYFTEVSSFPITDLQTIDWLWRVHSEGKFGFSVQRKIWISVGKDFTKLWPKIKWKDGNNWTRYPNEFIWDLSAPQGHLPLSNQLRGVRVINAILNHPAWSKQ
ncbi:Ycf53-like protein [Hyella patelloides LEGE 07179]|uniref:Ycf53-like protein n=1 Tax=Hyella patelloides LEGE 07179 TaxID=945734 RepID=A0A563VZ31_9CYAN|nr:GUN4 domain-containing protein [Hyella patelloides]VEP16722.1 Ycf53-like protein [Hyella patelloides LEGE 07179]